MRKLLVLLILFALIGGAGMMYWGRDRAAVAVAFRTAVVERGTVVSSISATGTVEPEELVDVGAQVAGQILSFGQDATGKTVDYGSRVLAGAMLATIDDAIYASEKTQAEARVLSAQGGLDRAVADLEQLRAKLRHAQRDWKRAQELGPSAALAATAYDNYKASCDSAKASVAVGEAAITQAKGGLAQAQSMLQRAKRNLGYTTIISPVTGVIIDRRVNIGQTVVASLNTPSLFLIAKDLTRMQVWVAVNEADIGRLRPGQPVTFTVEAFPGETFKGVVGKVRLNAAMTQNVVTYTVEVVADNSNGRLLPYLTANVKFELERHDNVLAVPTEALKWTPSTEQIAPEFRESRETEAPASQRSNLNLATSRPASVQAGTQGIIWVLNGQYVRPVHVQIGLSDGVVTEVQSEGLTEAMTMVTGQDETTSESATGSNPFLPKPPKHPKGGGPPPPPM